MVSDFLFRLEVSVHYITPDVTKPLACVWAAEGLVVIIIMQYI